MSFEIIILEKQQAIQIFNEKGDYIVLDFPNKNAWKNIKKFLEDSSL